MENDTYSTGVMFRAYPKGEVIALFTESYKDGSCNRGHCMSYMHVGQHSEASPRAVIERTRPIRPTDYETHCRAVELKKELEGMGYIFTRIVKRFPY